MKEVILCKYGEIILKGANKKKFETTLMARLRRCAKKCGNYKISYAQSTVFVEPMDDEAAENIDLMYETAKKVFGFAAVSRAAVTEKNMDAICEMTKEYLPKFLEGKKTFRAEAKRSDKRFPMKSPEIAGEVGAVLLDAVPGIKVDLNNPEITVKIEVREHEAYIHAGQEKGAGGMPTGSSGRSLLLLSGGIDSPVAGYMMAKRGQVIEAVHFESFPYTSEKAKEKVLELASQLSEYCGRIRVHVISLTHIQEELRRACDEDYFTLLLRRFMMALSVKTAKESWCGALITGESLGQVASQTLEAIAVTDCMSDIPVFRPCIGMDKEEIIQISRKIGTYDTSILPFEDCCTVFTPRHPRTKPELEKVEVQEKLVDFEALLNEAYLTKEIITINPNE